MDHLANEEAIPLRIKPQSARRTQGWSTSRENSLKLRINTLAINADFDDIINIFNLLHKKCTSAVKNRFIVSLLTI